MVRICRILKMDASSEFTVGVVAETAFTNEKR